MQTAQHIFLSNHYLLIVLSTFSLCIIGASIIAMALVLLGLYRSGNYSYQCKIAAMATEIAAMQKHLDYASNEETKARADAKRSAAAREKLLVSLSHEIRTPMNGILGMTILLEETSLDADQKDYVDTIISSGRILLNKVDEVLAADMLEQSKIDRSITAPQQKNTDIRNCIEEVVETCFAKSAATGIELLYEIEYDLPRQVITDNQRLYQVIINLADKVMDGESQQVFIGAHLLKHDNISKPVLAFSVLKDYPGDAMAVGALFAAGKTVSAIVPANITDEKQLGISISSKLAEEMGGQLKSIGGDAFILAIPFITTSISYTNNAEYQLTDFENKPVLIINDREDSADILKRQLQQWMMQPYIASTGAEALQLLENKPFKLVIADEDNIATENKELLHQIKELYPTLPLLLLSSLNKRIHTITENDVVRVNKPVRQHLLFDSILTSLRHAGKETGAEQISIKKLSADFSQQYPLRILVAEDNIVNQKWAIKILDKLGYKTDIAENGHAALEMVDNTAYDLILMDVQMPGMDGLEATKMIRTCLNKQPAIIAMTANVMHGDRIACMEAGMDDYISKPVQLHQLVNTLEKWALVIKDKKRA